MPEIMLLWTRQYKAKICFIQHKFQHQWRVISDFWQIMIDDQQIFDGSVSLISTYLSHMFEIFCLISKLNIRQYSTLVILVLLQSHFLSSDWIRFALFIFATSDICNTTCYFYCNVFLNHVEKLLISYAASISFNLKVILKGISFP